MSKIQIEHLGKGYQNRRQNNRDEDSHYGYDEYVPVLQDINLSFEEGEMVCLMGPSGCGKSTLLRIIAGFDQPSSGRVLTDGKEVQGPSSDHIFVFQHNGLLPWMTVRQNVRLGLRHMRESKMQAERIQEQIDLVELTGFENHYPHQISGGMQRRAELARALAVNPDLLIMDEPFTGLDFLTHMKMREEVVNMHEYLGKTMLMVTHDIDDGLIMGDRIIVLGGNPSEVQLERKLSSGRPRDLENDPNLNQLRQEIFLMLGVSYVV